MLAHSPGAALAMLVAGTLLAGVGPLLQRWTGRSDDPSYLILGMVGMLPWELYFLPRFRAADVLDALEERRSALFIGVPAMYRMLWEAGAPDLTACSTEVSIIVISSPSRARARSCAPSGRCQIVC